MQNNACSTCKERKIGCDGTSPVCQNCIRSKRICRRHKIRLSWPKENDRKREVLGSLQSLFRPDGTSTQFKFINTSSRDIEIYRDLLNPAGLNTQNRQIIGTFVPAPRLSLLSHRRFECGEAELVPYFFSIVLPLVPAFSINIERLRGVVARLALLDDSAPSRAVINSLLALAALHKSGNRRQATRLVAESFNSLRASVQNGINIQEGLHHIVAGMLICSFEIHLFSQSSSLWLLNLFATKRIITRLYQRGSSKDDDQSLLFQWVFYFDTLARLGIKHGRGFTSLRSQLEKEVGFDQKNLGQITGDIAGFTEFAHKAVALLAEFSIGVLTPEDPKYRSTEYLCWLNRIERQLFSIRRELQKPKSLHDLANQSESVAVKELFVLATLLYFEKKSKQLVGSSSKTEEWIEDAFLILSRLDHCNKPSPLFVFGREARTDDRRLLILRIIDRTVEKAKSCTLVSLRELLVKLWVQEDLNGEGNADDQRDGCFLLSVSNIVLCLL